MSKENIIRAWKDPEYRSTLNAHDHASLPANPAGTIDDGKLAEVVGGAIPVSLVRDCTHSWEWVCLTSWFFIIC
jgi:mersacidin/lichenicidin family type 2 lantibiotic